MGLVKRKQKFSTIAIAFFAMEIASIEIAFAKDKPPAPPVDVSKIDATKPGPPAQPIPLPYPNTGCTENCQTTPKSPHPAHSDGHH
jgi:hypothetical protein